MTSTSFAHLSNQVLVEELKKKSIDEREVLEIVEEEGRTWMTPIYEYLTEEILPEEKRKARAIRRKASQYVVTNKILYKRSLGEGIKIQLDKRSKNWMEEISHVLLAHRTMIKSSNGETPFSLTCGMEAVIPVEIGIEQAAIQEAKSKAMMEKYYNARVRNTSFKPGDLVYQSNEASHAKEGGNLRPKWKGPYEVTEALGKRSVQA
nr:retrovirus-related Pol polyprotein from transposon TNT 1-94 [Tanacetum cinerariifolium]